VIVSMVAEVVGDYTIGQQICEGSYGRVCKSTKTNDPSTFYAIKIVSKAKHVEDEVSIQRLFDHPNILKMVDTFATSESHYMVLEYCPGGDLFDFMQKRRSIDEQTAARIFKQMLDAITVLHKQNVVHHDIKLENFLLSSDGKVKLCDFGAAERSKDGMTQKYKGEASAPEKQEGRFYNGYRADVYQLGKSLHELSMALKLPKNSCHVNPPPMSRPSPSLIDLLSSLLHLDPSKRPSLEAIAAHPWLQQQQQSKPKGAIPPAPQGLPQGLRQQMLPEKPFAAPQQYHPMQNFKAVPRHQPHLPVAGMDPFGVGAQKQQDMMKPRAPLAARHAPQQQMPFHGQMKVPRAGLRGF
jgi:serine/threonine protein kinase